MNHINSIHGCSCLPSPTIKPTSESKPILTRTSPLHFPPSQPSERRKVKVKKRAHTHMEIELVKCECCGLKEECTQDYISEVKAKFEGRWLCGLCSEAVRDEVSKWSMEPFGSVEEAVMAHMSFCNNYKSSPALRVADGMRQILRRRSGNLSSSPSSSPSLKKYSSSSSSTRVGGASSFSLC